MKQPTGNSKMIDWKLIAFSLALPAVMIYIAGSASEREARQAQVHVQAQAQGAAERAKWTKLRPDLDAHTYWTRRCQPMRDVAAAYMRQNPNGMDAAIAVVAVPICENYERLENDNTASIRELWETCLGQCERLPAPASLRN
jgi:hypothetical protein